MIVLGDCLEVMRGMEENSVDSIVTDPPYGLAFMGKKWDYDVPSIEMWKEAIRVLKPGGHLLAFGGTRTYHRLAVAIEDSGFEIRDQVQWVYGSGFPKSLDVSKAIDKAAGAEREVVGLSTVGGGGASNSKGFKDGSGGSFQQVSDGKNGIPITAPSTDAAKQWQGFGTALKPANEPIVLARKPLSEKTVAANVLKWGTGGINVDGCRVEYANQQDIEKRLKEEASRKSTVNKAFVDGRGTSLNVCDELKPNAITAQGRFPSNLLLDETAAEMLDGQSGVLKTGGPKSHPTKPGCFGGGGGNTQETFTGSAGGASRFFYVAKASKRERNEGLEDKSNGHPTVKPITLMRYLCRLITPPNGLVLDPFCGSGSTGVAALKERFRFIGIERESEYVEIARKRMGTEIHE